MKGFSDSAIFHRLHDLLWTFNEPEAVALLNPEEKACLMEFNEAFASLAWRPIVTHPHISEVPDNDLSPLIPSSTCLLKLLEKRITS
jgi:hypothetical protein